MHTVERLADAPLADLFPGLAQDVEARLVRVAGLLDRARLPEDRAEWQWPVGQVIGASTSARDLMSLIIDTTLAVRSTGSDWLELALNIWRAAPPLMVVNAAVEVACWCTPDHNMHPGRQSEWLAGDLEAPAVAFSDASETVRAWLYDAQEPNAWRARAGLRGPPS